LHSGEKIRLTLRPAPEDSGITFLRTDVAGAKPIPALLDNVVHTRLATTLGSNGISVATVEHLMAAMAGLGVDNCQVEVSGAEVPIMDGSSAPFVYLLKDAGVVPQSKYKKFVIIKKPVEVRDDNKFVHVAPDREFSIHYNISFDHPLIRSQDLDFRYDGRAFEKEISRARTFGFLHEVEYMKKNGFARGGSLSNAVVIDRFRILNKDGLRYDDEFIRHKVLDFIGDISLMGAPIIGKFTASKSGHTLNNVLLNQLATDTAAWELVEISNPGQCRERNLTVPSWGLLDAPATSAAA
jgi:UDP-3-O-[3-hydroxymyristoyl] N-acetylglucosamine deacetylase